MEELPQLRTSTFIRLFYRAGGVESRLLAQNNRSRRTHVNAWVRRLLFWGYFFSGRLSALPRSKS
jgi:hypothetical protein